MKPSPRLSYLCALCVLSWLMNFGTASATMLPPEFTAYDFSEAYYIEDGGVVISPYAHGFYCKDGIQTPEGIRIMPGKTFMQFDASRMIVDEYKLLYLNKPQNRAYFHQKSYLYSVVKDAKGKYHDIIGKQVASNHFYLTKWRGLEWADHVFTNIEIHPGAQAWRTRPQYIGEASQ